MHQGKFENSGTKLLQNRASGSSLDYVISSVPRTSFTFNLVFRKHHPTVDTECLLTPWIIFTTVSPTETGAGDSLILQPQKLRFGDPINSPKLMGRVELTLEFLCMASKHRCLGNGSDTTLVGSSEGSAISSLQAPHLDIDSLNQSLSNTCEHAL